MYIGRKLAKFKMLLICKKKKALNSFMHNSNMSVLYLPSINMNILKALGGVEFTKYALLPISQYVHWTKIG